MDLVDPSIMYIKRAIDVKIGIEVWGQTLKSLEW